LEEESFGVKFTTNFVPLSLKVGGDLSFWVLNNMNEFGRVALCGAITAYNEDPKSSRGITI
jgi:hypothetical protein